MKVKSLRYRIAITIFVLQVFMMVAVLWPTLNNSFHASKEQLADTEEITLKTLAELGRIAFLTAEYNDIQPFLEIAVLEPHILRVLLLNPDNIVYASHDAIDIGNHVHQFESTEQTYWRGEAISNAAGKLGSLWINFSNQALETVYADTLQFAFTIAIIGIMLSAIAGIALGALLTNRLVRLNQVASEFASGNLSVRAELHNGSDEINDLTVTFNHMADDISNALRTLRESESRFRGIFVSANDAIFLVDLKNDRIIDANPAACKMLEYDEINELLKIPISVLHQDAMPNLHVFIDKVIANGSATTENFTCITKNNKIIATSISASLTNIGGKTLLLVQARDISEREQYEKSLCRAQKMEAIGQLAGGIAHDFNNILGIILGNLDLLEYQLITDKKIQKRLDSIKHSAHRASELTQKMLGLSHHEGASTAVTNINQIILDMHNILARSLTPQIEIVHHLANDLWHTEIDAGDFEDMLLNMVLNARDAMSGSGNLTIETCNCVLDNAYCESNAAAMPGEYVQLTVSDNGTGMPQEVLDRIFEPFFTTKEVGKGTGLGLAMAFGFVERSGGTIKVDTELGVGTTFRLYLPRTMHKRQGTENKKHIKKLPTSNKTILVVDDEVALIELVEEMLQTLGYKVLTATDSKKALQILATEKKVDLMFSDVVMPGGLNGFELAEQVAKLYPAVNILLTSGFTDVTIARNAQARFETNFLSKPYTQHELALRIRTLLSQ